MRGLGVAERACVDRGGQGGFAHDADTVAHFGEDLGVDRGGAAGHHDGRLPVRAQRMAHRLARLLLGFPGDGAGVHDDEIGVRFGPFDAPAGRKRGRERVGLDAIHLAPKVHDGVLHGCLPNPPSS